MVTVDRQTHCTHDGVCVGMTWPLKTDRVIVNMVELL